MEAQTITTEASTDIEIARSGAHKKKDKKMKNGLKRSLLFREETQVNCEGGVAIMDEFDGLLQRNNKEMIGLRQRAAACQGEIETRRFQSEKRLASAENQLETAMLRFNAIRYENKKIREEIEHMLNDRLLFNQAWDKMLTALGKGKKFLSDLFESSTLAYGQRDEWVAKLRSIQEKGKMDQMLQVQKEQENFSIYKLIADYCAENQVLTRDLQRTRQEIVHNKLQTLHQQLEAQSRRTGALRAQYEQQDRLLKDTMEKTLYQQLEAQSRRTGALRAQYEQQDRLLKDTMEKVQDIF
ncbi:Uncharacterized protein OBRU01_03021, partial [Operophtera brumata]